MDISPRLSGEEWQTWATRLVKMHYGPAEYQKVPDNQKGDAGIEGFAIRLGHAYQMYGPEEPLTTDERYRKHRTKMSDDLRKFVKNQNTLSEIFGKIKVRRWILLVPHFDSKEIIKHATKKTEDVLAANLPYVDSQEFRVVVMDEDEFSIERESLLNANLALVSIGTDDISASALIDWAHKHDDLVQTLDRKILRIPTLRNDDARREFRNLIIRHFLEGQNTLEELRKYPTAYENIRIAKGERERYLATEVMLASGLPHEILVEALGEIEQTVRGQVRQVSDGTVKAVAWEAVSDWLIRCPLDFPAEA
jgi:hypothetical protein